VVVAILYLLVVGWQFTPQARSRHVVAAIAAIALIDVSTIAAMHCRYVIWPLAQGPFARFSGLSAPDGDPRRWYADNLLKLPETDAATARSLPLAAVYGAEEKPENLTPVPIESIQLTYNSATIQVNTDRDTHLLWRNRFFPGWSASVRAVGADHARTNAPVRRAFGMFMAVAVPAGRHEIVFRFAPRAFVPLFWWTYVWLTLLALVTWGCVIRRQSVSGAGRIDSRAEQARIGIQNHADRHR
jgi:hypothetical protein